jgi:hypothetical protein
VLSPDAHRVPPFFWASLNDRALMSQNPLKELDYLGHMSILFHPTRLRPFVETLQ